jgi:hypothetical protein
MTFAHTHQNTLLNRMMAFWVFSCVRPLKHKRNKDCMNTCQSCAFMLATSWLTHAWLNRHSIRMVPLKMQTGFEKLGSPHHLAHNWDVTSSTMMCFVG